MNRTFLAALLVAAAQFALGCGSKAVPDQCDISNSFETRKLDARSAAKSSYQPPTIQPCPELDPPADGEESSIGLSADEYSSLLRGANGNFLDDHLWWIKAMPRGASHVAPMQITAEWCDAVTYDKFGYEYPFAIPPLTTAPECGRYLTGIQVGHRTGDALPRVFSIEGSGLMQLAPSSGANEFGVFAGLPRGPLDSKSRDSAFDRLDIVRHDGDSLELVAFGNGSTFSSAARLVLKVGDTTRSSVQLELYPRSLAAEGSPISVASLSGSFSVGGARNFDRLRATFTDGTSFEMAFSDPDLEWGSGAWTRVPLVTGAAALETLTLLQDGTQPDGKLYPNVSLSNFQASVPLVLDLSVMAQPAFDGNVVADLLVDGTANAGGEPISVSYLVTASVP
ncbi:MAG TPA: hypothetical protein VER11_10330 [Polyangiaceae bacterium]|nr:hypothetical protein [Polyangiaceae bacterium]